MLLNEHELANKLIEILDEGIDIEKAIINEDDYQVFYHLTPVRKNLFSWLDIRTEDCVLEIGAQAGAITAQLCEMAGQVCAMERSEELEAVIKKRVTGSVVPAVTRKSLSDITEQFDWILVSNFSVALGASGCNDIKELLFEIKKHLSENGQAVLVMENKIGLKHLAAKEIAGNDAESFSHSEYEMTLNDFKELISNSGFKNERVFYPFPDSIAPLEIYSDKMLPKKGALKGNKGVIPNTVLVYNNMEEIYDSLCEQRIVENFLNSFLVICQ